MSDPDDPSRTPQPAPHSGDESGFPDDEKLHTDDREPGIETDIQPPPD